jgi:uncharacterized protein (TIGR00255 family)
LAAVQSMTAFARQETSLPWGCVSWEIRSVNHRYLEVQLRLPDTLRQLEMPARDLLRERLGRGKVDCSLRLQTSGTSSGPIVVNDTLVRQLNAACAQVDALSSGGLRRPSTLDVLSWPGVMAESALDLDQLATAAMDSFASTIEELVAMRSREGASLAEFIEQRLASIELEIASVRRVLPGILLAQQQKLRDRLAELSIELDPSRLEQEAVLLAAKADVTEELDRIQAHLKETRHSLAKGGACGRRLDFLMQEFNREANTLSSKSIAAETTRVAVELKVLIEQMREQVQNIE